MADKLNLAIILDNDEIFLWQYRILEKLISCNSASLKLFILNEVENSKVNFKEHSLIYKFHEKIDRFIFRKEIDYDKKIKVFERFDNIPLVKLVKQPDQRILRNYKLDLLLNFGHSIIQSEILKEFRFGSIAYKISSQLTNTDAPSCYWEVIKRKPEIEASIQLTLPDEKNEIEIFHTGILPYPNSININRNNLYELASLLIPRVIERIFNDGIDFLDSIRIKRKENFKSHEKSEFCQPSSFQAFLNFILLQFNFLAKKIQYHKIGRWFLMFKIHEKESFFPYDLESFKFLKAPKNKFWADPFVVSADNFHYIFIEEYLYKTDKGHISVLKLNDKGKLLSIDTLIEKPYHMSYPFIFKKDDFFYMVPETGSNSTIELYKCTEFPGKWEFVKNIMENLSAKDTTLFFYNNRWWLFTSVIERNNATISYNELFLYHSDDLFSSNWQSHPMNPIVSDLKLSRPAGKIFIRDGKIYRPSQDCSGIYGRALNINCITKLNETDYEEVLISKTEPNWNNKIKGIHTYNFDEKISVMDVFSFRSRAGNYN